MKHIPHTTAVVIFSAALMLVSACRPVTPTNQINVVATTSIIADVAVQIGGEFIYIQTLLPVGTDPHSFDPTPQDVVKVAEADLILANGAGLEEFLKPLIESAEAEDRVIFVTTGTDFIETGQDHSHSNEHEDEHGEEDGHDETADHENETDHDHQSEGVDPHTWTDPNNVLLWVEHIEREFAKLDPEHAAQYAENAEEYRIELEQVDNWVREQVSQIPENKRIIATDHTAFTYFARQYGFQQAGAIVPGYSTLAEPTAQELAALEDAITGLDVNAVFVGNTVNPSLAQRLAEDTGIQLVFIYTGSLSEPGGEADSYIKYIRYNVSAIVDALQTD
jgi:ABC-type Zn uptake system ZnuABC Zn-binding protein ZnuA